MSLFDDLTKQVTAETGGSDAHARMAAAALQMLNAQGGNGLQNLVQTFQSHGLGDMMASWIGTGPNPPITPDQVHSVLGADKVQQLAQQTGVSPDLAKALLAAVLPVLVDKLTPQGSLPAQGSLLGEGVDLLKKFL